MNRRKFCTNLALVPAAAVAVSTGVKAAPAINTGNVSLQFPKLYPYQREMLRRLASYDAITHDGTMIDFKFVNTVRYSK